MYNITQIKSKFYCFYCIHSKKDSTIIFLVNYLNYIIVPRARMLEQHYSHIVFRILDHVFLIDYRDFLKAIRERNIFSFIRHLKIWLFQFDHSQIEFLFDRGNI